MASIACITALDFASSSPPSSSPSSVGTICHDTPYVFELTAVARLAARGELRPEIVDFGLRLT